MAQVSKEELVVKIDVQSEEFVEVLNNIRFGFEDVNKRIFRLWGVIGLLAGSNVGLAALLFATR